jgi:hypothetical protein
MPLQLKVLRIVGAAAFALVMAASTVEAAIIYTINRTIGAGGVTGFVETDGTIGALGAGNILDWDLMIDDGTGTFNLLGPISGPNSNVLIIGSSFIGTATQLIFDFSGSGLALFQNPSNGSGINFWCLEVSGCTTNGTGETVALNYDFPQFVSYSGREVIGTASVPEPASLFLLGAGVLASAFRSRKRPL